ncbi:hypothetical protein AOQ84DRAFT_338301 [Glonium stellatum]|uniref:BTB domain-containing protein n=1 Tax=Glonium stellatum TaxID=574774 RepID=A0A8E2F3G9_9PEZI|nr:hypothetical protein AOQ84DRAFT_338301 [Glonium stellatum]
MVGTEREAEKGESSRGREMIPDVAKGRKLKFSEFLTSPIVSVLVGNRRTFLIHSGLLNGESEKLCNSLKGGFVEAEEWKINLPDEDPELFGYYVEYLYRDSPLLTRSVANYCDYVTLARLYALGERLGALNFQSIALRRFTASLQSNTPIPELSVCELLEIACATITARLVEDPMRAQIFWYASSRIPQLQKFDMFRQLLKELPELGGCLCMTVSKPQPAKPAESSQMRFEAESEYSLESSGRFQENPWLCETKEIS